MLHFRFVDRDMLMLFMGGGVGHSFRFGDVPLYPTEPGLGPPEENHSAPSGGQFERELDLAAELDVLEDSSEDGADEENADTGSESGINLNMSDDGYGSA